MLYLSTEGQATECGECVVGEDGKEMSNVGAVSGLSAGGMGEVDRRYMFEPRQLREKARCETVYWHRDPLQVGKSAEENKDVVFEVTHVLIETQV